MSDPVREETGVEDRWVNAVIEIVVPLSASVEADAGTKQDETADVLAAIDLSLFPNAVASGRWEDVTSDEHGGTIPLAAGGDPLREFVSWLFENIGNRELRAKAPLALHAADRVAAAASSSKRTRCDGCDGDPCPCVAAVLDSEAAGGRVEITAGKQFLASSSKEEGAFGGRAFGAVCVGCDRIVGIHMQDPSGPGIDLAEWNEGLIEFLGMMANGGGDRLRFVALLAGEWDGRLGRCRCPSPEATP